MMNPGVSEEVGKTARGIVQVMESQPLSLALVLMNVLLVAYLFYSGSQMLSQRQEASKMIMDWSSRTDVLLGNCVSLEVTKLVLDNMQRITDTMLASEKQEIQRMQRAIDRERDINARLRGITPPAPVATPPDNEESKPK